MNPRFLRPWGVALTCGALAACQESPTDIGESTEVLPASSQAALAANNWVTRANMPSDRFRPAVAVATNAQGQTVLYAIGGTTKTFAPLGTVQAYNAATNTWINRAAVPVALSNTNGAGFINGRIYLSGGQLWNDRMVPYLFVYEVATNRWTRKRDMIYPASHGVTGVSQNQLYVLTSCSGRRTTDGQGVNEPGCSDNGGRGIYRYDPATDRWTFLSPAPSSHFAGMGGFIGGKFYLTGGSSEYPRGRLDVYNPVTNTWSTGAPMPAGRSQAAYAAIGARLYIAGGIEEDLENNGHFFHSQSLIRYDPTTDSWTTLAPMPELRDGIAGGRVVVNGKARFEVVGGSRPRNNWQYTP